MIWQFLDWLTSPDDYAVTVKNGEFYIEPIADLTARGVRIR